MKKPSNKGFKVELPPIPTLQEFHQYAIKTIPKQVGEFLVHQATKDLLEQYPPLEAFLDPNSPRSSVLSEDVYVHEHCLKHGVKCESKLCPIALALIQHFGTKDVMVLSCAIYIGDQIYRMNEPLINKLRDFDRGCLMAPYHFTLR